MNKKISVIVPAYNVEKYIEKCINSIIKQSYKNIEVIVVDDGSTDKTSKICDKIAKADNRIVVIHQQNQGLSQARNNGIKVATGNYISLVDGDDIVGENFLQNMISAVHSNIDVVISGYKTIDGSENEIDINQKASITLSGQEATIELLTQQENYFVIAWNKLYEKDLFTENNIWYPVGRIHEDNLTTYRLLSKARNVAIIDAADYLYIKHPGSITSKSKKSQQINEKINAAKEAVVFFAKSKELFEAANYSLFLAQIIALNESIKNNDTDLRCKITSDILKSNYSKNKFCTTKGKIYIFMLKTLSGKPYVMFRKIVDKVL